MPDSVPPSASPDGDRATTPPGALRTELGAAAAILPPDAAPAGGDLVPSLQAALGGAYVVERELGGGGMSRVFVAQETALQRRVAIKVLSPELLQGASAERFAREVALAARLQDPHIVPVLTTGATADGIPFYTMPFIEGESLRERLTRGSVPIDEALRIMRDVAEALEYAHVRGIVHRDIKPENVLLSGRNAVVADFGIAKAMSAARASAPSGTLTSIGFSLGTPAYMAPEQAAGDAVDHRADLYSWGVMAWELLAGRHPYAPRTLAAQLMAAHLTELPPPVDEVRPGLPPTLGALVMACLAKSPDDRPSDAAAVLAALGGATTDLAITSGRRPPVAVAANRRRNLLAGGAAMVLALGATGAWLVRRGDASERAAGAGASATALPSLAVLPFEHQGDSADTYLTEGITDEVRNKLTGVSTLLVIARASSNQYRNKGKSPQEIAKELGVRWLLTGTVQVLGSGTDRRVVVRPELVEVMADGRLQSKGGQPFDGPLTDVVKAQGEVAAQVVSGMEVAVGGSDRAKLVELPTTNPEAYDLYLRGRAAGEAGGSPVQAIKRALPFFEAAVTRDSALVEGWRSIAGNYAGLYAQETPSPAYAQKARAALARLEALAPRSADALRARANIKTFIERDAAGAYQDMLAARRLTPGDAIVARNLAAAKANLGQLDDALRDYDAVVRLDPQTAAGHNGRAVLLQRLGRFAEARSAMARARAIAPAAQAFAFRAIGIELSAGDLPAARRVLAEALRDIPRDKLLALLATYNDQWWVPDGADATYLAELPADAYDGLTVYLTVRAQVFHARGDRARATVYADSAVRALTEELIGAPNDAQTHVLLGLMHAYAGRAPAAMAAVERGLAISRARDAGRGDLLSPYYLYVAARTAALVGDRDRAIDYLRECMTYRSEFTAAYLRIDPTVAPLRGDPAFERVLAGTP